MKLLALLLIFAALMTRVAHGGEAPPSDAVEAAISPEGCRIERFTVASPTMGRAIRTVVVLPPAYVQDGTATYPVLYALHGRGAPYTVWSDMAPLRAALKDQPMIVASFSCDVAGWYIDSTQKADSQFMTFFFEEFMPAIETRYRASGVRGVTGFSMGGYGALSYMVERPHLFASASGLSSAVGGLVAADGSGHRDFQNLLGPYEQNKAAYAKLSITNRIAAWVAKEVKLPPILLHCGTEDYLLPHNRDFITFLIAQNKLIGERLAPRVADEQDTRRKQRELGRLMEAYRIDFTYIESPGAHNWEFWRSASANVVDFHYKSFQRD